MLLYTSLHLYIIEVAQLYLQRSCKYIRPNWIYKTLINHEPLLFHEVTIIEIRNTLIELFPVYKNKRKKTQSFKISKICIKRFIDNSEIAIKDISTVKMKLYELDFKN
ncbi:MAG: hypothetical protein IPO78_13710 [Saprospiraceae bacterium]|nr:hypothetical protein [Saprospiraceae bacterium]